ncbi:MAG: hypothetical protein JRI23_05125 [Deltaproteobacteria bacterium]|jgi:hypothetical protein|nr:hypothetical protein [Deltaproteobacteria bacterium]MBW2530933.1 hypothetical protein [Deltaproteobacteria bacterium]
MAKYHLDWNMVESRIPNDPKEIAQGWKMLIGLVNKDLEHGALKDWGAYPGDHGGFAVFEGSEMDLMMFTMKYAPYVDFRTKPVASANQVTEFLIAAAK